MEQKELTPKEALAVLENATAALKLDRNEHGYLIHALQVLLKLVEQNNVEETKIDSKEN